MKKPIRNITVCTAFALGLVLVQTAETKASELTLEQWQLNLIFNPDEQFLQREAEGFVFIYDRLRDTQVDYILDHYFDRIDAMMFTRVKMTDQSGDIKLDPETGEELTVDDGCD